MPRRPQHLVKKRVPSITLQWKVTALGRIGLSACGQERRLIGNGLPGRGGPSVADRPRTHYLLSESCGARLSTVARL